MPKEASADASGGADDLATVMEQGWSDADDDALALASVKRGLFGEPAAPLMLARYVLLERIGIGGLGVVYAAYDPQLDRRVAIKLLRAKRGRGATRERLVREAQAMAKLAHPNVITVHDVGTYGGPEGPVGPPGVESEGIFVVMEHVEGASLDIWLAERARPWPEILETLVAAGRGLLAAHRAGLVHRDFKPSNVLVDGDGRVRVLDFGLARIDASQSEGTPDPPLAEDEPRALDVSLTRTGGLLGTPAYMPPEQHEGARADARADQYAFCVTLWEALYGERPFTGRDLNALAAQKQAAQLPADPPRPQVPRRIHRALCRGLAPDPADRHPSLGALLRHLERRPARRLALAVSIATAGLLGGASMLARAPAPADPCSGFASMLDGAWDDEIRGRIAGAFQGTELPFAERTFITVAATLDDYATTWVDLRRQVCVSTRITAEQPAAVMERRFACLDRGLEGLRRVGSLLAAADASVVVRAPEIAEELPSLDACQGPWADAALADDDAGTRGKLELSLAQAQLLRAAGRYSEALTHAAEAVAIARGSEHAGGLSRALLAHALTLLDVGDEQEAERELFEAIAAAERAGDEATAASALVHASRVLVAEARSDEAERLLAMAEAKIERHGLDPALRIELLHAEGDLLRRRGRMEDALANARVVLEAAEARYDPSHTEIARARTRLAVALHEGGDTEAGAAVLEAAREVYVASLGEEHPHAAEMLGLLANLDDDRGAYARSLERHRRVVAILEGAYGPAHAKVAQARVNLASSLMVMGERDAALAELRVAAASYEAAGKSEHVDMGTILVNVATLERERGHLEAALSAGDRAVQLLERDLGPSHPSAAMATAVRAQVLSALGRHDEAVDTITVARDRVREALGEHHPLVGMLSKALAEAEVARGSSRVALHHFEDAVRILSASGGDLREIVTARISIARELARDDPERARRELTEARRSWLAAGRAWAEIVPEDEPWMRALPAGEDL